MLGCLAFVWFAAALRDRLVAAEGGTASSRASRSRAPRSAPAFGMLAAGDVGAAIDKDNISAATAGTIVIT